LLPADLPIKLVDIPDNLTAETFSAIKAGVACSISQVDQM